jgi:cell cycle arrest protein BUB3
LAPLTRSHNTFASGGSDGFLSIWDHHAKKRMKAYAKYPTSISALAFSPDGKRLAIGCSNQYDNALASASPEDAGRVMLLVKETVAEDCKVSCDAGRVEKGHDS